MQHPPAVFCAFAFELALPPVKNGHKLNGDADDAFQLFESHDKPLPFVVPPTPLPQF